MPKIEITVYERKTTCDGPLPSILYDEENKTFVETHRGYLTHPTVKFIPLAEKIEELLKEGTWELGFEDYMSILDFAAQMEELFKTFSPRFETGDLVWKECHSNGKMTPVLCKVGEIAGWKVTKSCTSDGIEEKTVICKRDFIAIESGYVSCEEEHRFKPVQSYEDWKEGVAAIKKVIAGLKKDGVLGGVIHYAGNVYKIG